MSPFHTSTNPAIVRELGTGERILWSGQPDPSREFRRAVRGLLFAVPLEAFALSHLWSGVVPLGAALMAGRAPTVAMLHPLALGVLFVLAIAHTVHKPWQERAKARRTFYVLTNLRAFIVIEGSKQKAKTVSPDEFSLHVNDLPDGKGDLILKIKHRRNGKGNPTTLVMFSGISQAREVEHIARELAQGAR